MFWVLKRTISLRCFFNTHNICFGVEIRRLNFWYTHLTKGLNGVILMKSEHFTEILPIQTPAPPPS